VLTRLCRQLRASRCARPFRVLPERGGALALHALIACLALSGLASPRVADAQGVPPPPAHAPAGAPANTAAVPAGPATSADEPDDNTQRLVELGVGDSVAIQVYGQPDLAATVYVSDDGTIPVGLVGAVKVIGLSPSEAAHRVEDALRDGNFLVNPHVSMTVTQSRSQRVTVLGEVKNPGRYQIESNTTIFDLLAQAGGTTQASSDVVYLVRREKDGSTQRYPINLKGLGDGGHIPTETLQGGDSLFVPHADTFSVMGEVRNPNSYPLEPGMTVMQAVARAGGITDRGSSSRIQIVRRLENDKFVTLKAEMTDVVKPNDVIRVKQSIF